MTGSTCITNSRVPAEPTSVNMNTSLVNITLPVPDGTTTYDDLGIICTPPGVKDFIWFYFGNYISHAATIMTLPGQNNLSILNSVIWALASPTSGLAQGLRVIFRGATLLR